ncbi:MAG: tyrosine-type recombinase/integrase [Dehalococcoidales bacterium]
MKAYLEFADIELMEGVASSQRDRLLIRLLSRLGCRVSEALAIKDSEIDFNQNTITIKHLKRRIKLSCPGCKTSLSKRSRFCPGCGQIVEEIVKREQDYRRIRTLPIDSDTLSLLKEYVMSKQSAACYREASLFNINRHRAWQIVRDCGKRAGLPGLVNPETGRTRGISPHRLRDAFSVHAMKMDDSGDGLRLLQEHLGHASFDTTAKYRKIAGVEHRAWYDRLWKQNTFVR